MGQGLTPNGDRLVRKVLEHNTFPTDTAPRFLLHDRDSIFANSFAQRVESMGIEEVVTAPGSPWQNPYCERLIGSIGRECPDPRAIEPPGMGKVVAYPQVTVHPCSLVPDTLAQHLTRSHGEYGVLVADDGAYPKLLAGVSLDVLIRRDDSCTAMEVVSAGRWQDIDYVLASTIGIPLHLL